jgi:hypothetical protein
MFWDFQNFTLGTWLSDHLPYGNLRWSAIPFFGIFGVWHLAFAMFCLQYGFDELLAIWVVFAIVYMVRPMPISLPFISWGLPLPSQKEVVSLKVIEMGWVKLSSNTSQTSNLHHNKQSSRKRPRPVWSQSCQRMMTQRLLMRPQKEPQRGGESPQVNWKGQKTLQRKVETAWTSFQGQLWEVEGSGKGGKTVTDRLLLLRSTTRSPKQV